MRYLRFVVARRAMAQAPSAAEAEAEAEDIDFEELLAEFRRVQDAHRRYKLQDRARARLDFE